jgi:hypothetical protein
VPTAPDAHVLGRGGKADGVALHLGEPVEELEAEGGRFRVNAVRAADGGCVLELDGAAPEHREQRGNSFLDERGRFLHLQRLRGVYDVVRRKPVVQPPGLGVEALALEAFGDRRGEGDDVVLHLRLDLGDARGRHRRFGRDGFGSGQRNHAVFGQHRARRGFDLKPAAVLVLVCPDAAHRRARVAFDQGRAPRSL